jgi:hypothetical protein
MPFPALSAAIACAARVVAPTSPGATDGQLLGRFIATRDEHAFAELMHRIGPTARQIHRHTR